MISTKDSEQLGRGATKQPPKGVERKRDHSRLGKNNKVQGRHFLGPCQEGEMNSIRNVQDGGVREVKGIKRRPKRPKNSPMRRVF